MSTATRPTPAVNLVLNLVVAVGACLAGPHALAQSSCQVVFNGSHAPQATAHAWRVGSTHLTAKGEAAPTSTAREQWLKQAQTSMEKFMTEEIDTPEMVFAVADGVTSTAPKVAITNRLKNTIPLNYTTNAAEQGFHYDEIPRIKVTGLGSSG